MFNECEHPLMNRNSCIFTPVMRFYKLKLDKIFENTKEGANLCRIIIISMEKWGGGGRSSLKSTALLATWACAGVVESRFEAS